MSVDTSNYAELSKYFDEILNLDKSTYKTSNDEPTPIGEKKLRTEIPIEMEKV
jgi:hypothetical protein